MVVYRKEKADFSLKQPFLSLVPRPASFLATRTMSKGLGSKIMCVRTRVKR